MSAICIQILTQERIELAEGYKWYKMDHEMLDNWGGAVSI